MAREARFPGINWYCDQCGSFLNNQKGFNDHKYLWKCKECGYKNSLSRDNICPGDSKATRFLLTILGFLSYIGLWTAVMLAIALFGFHESRELYFIPFLIFCGLYLFAFVLSLVVEFGIRRTKLSAKNLFGVVFRNLKEDLIQPLIAIKELINNLLSFITHKLPFKRKKEWFSNKSIVLFALVYTLVFIAEVVILSRIIDFSADDWLKLIQKGIVLLRK